MEDAPATASRTKNRVFRPVLWWLVVSSLLLLWRFHYTHIPNAAIRFKVSLEAGLNGYSEIRLNDSTYVAGTSCGLGRKTLRIDALGHESFETNAFVWYGGVDLGRITLPRTRGRLELKFSPAAETALIRSPETNLVLRQITQESVLLPTGEYRVEAKFARFEVKRTAEVTWNSTSRVDIAHNMTAVNLTSVPESSEFELRLNTTLGVSVRGRTPALITDLPSGDYSLMIWRGSYWKELTNNLSGKATNELKVEFRYYKLAVTSDPTDAIISEDGKVLGRTPANLELSPGIHALQIGKQGHFGTNVSVTVDENGSSSIAVSLVNIAYVDAMARARSVYSGTSPNYDRALAAVEEALRSKPEDEAGLRLKRSIEFSRHIRNAKQLQGSGNLKEAMSEVEAAASLGMNETEVLALKAELQKSQLAVAATQAEALRRMEAALAEKRLDRPMALLKETTRRAQHDELFDAQMLEFTGSIEEARTRIVRAFAAKPEWNVQKNESVDKEAVLITAETKSILSRRSVVLVIGQATDTEVRVCFKLFDFMPGEIGEAAFVPRHARFAKGDRINTIGQSRSQNITELKQRLGTELR